MKLKIIGLLLLLSILTASACDSNSQQSGDMFVRIAEIEIDSASLGEYLSILKEESAASVRLEAGVISIYPMYEKQRPTEVRILEIYRDRVAYEAHLQTPHFKHYKTTTLKMVKSLNLVEMQSIDAEAMSAIFKKLSK